MRRDLSTCSRQYAMHHGVRVRVFFRRSSEHHSRNDSSSSSSSTSWSHDVHVFFSYSYVTGIYIYICFLCLRVLWTRILYLCRIKQDGLLACVVWVRGTTGTFFSVRIHHSAYSVNRHDCGNRFDTYWWCEVWMVSANDNTRFAHILVIGSIEARPQYLQ